jgi:hypothetical protein
MSIVDLGIAPGPVAEIDDRFAKNAACRISPQPRAPGPVEKRQAEFTGMLIDTAFAGARDLPFAHQNRHV